MAKQYKVIVNTGKSGDNQIVDVSPGWGRGGQPVKIKALAGAKYQLQEIQRNQQTAPEHVKVKRVGKDLWVVFEGQRDADLIIEDYYEVMTTPSNNLVGRAENGSFYEYIPEDPNVQGLVPNLREGAMPINVALGGAEISGAGAAVAVVGAAFGGWGLIGGLAASVAAGAVVGTLINNNKKTTPSIALSSDTPLSPGQSSTIRFTLSEDSSDFKAEDIAVTGGTLSNFQGSGKNYTATFTPNAGASTAEVRVNSDKFSNSAGQFNKDGGDANNAVTMNPVVTDTTPPTVVVNADASTLASGQSTNISFALSEDSTDFTASDVSVTGGTLSNFQGSGKNYTATFTPTAGVSSAEVRINSDTFKDAAGNANKDGADTNNAVQLSISKSIDLGADNTPPTIAVSSDRSTLSTGQQAIITFALSEASNDFTASDVSVSGGTLSNFQGSGNTYTATFTPVAGSVGQSVIKVDSLRFRDGAGNLNIDGTESNNTVTMPTNTVGNAADTTPPTIAISSNKTSLANGESATISFALSEASSTFAQSDVQVSGGTLSNFQGSGSYYTATFTANSAADSSVHVPNNVFSDAAGNWNADAAESNNLVTMTGGNLPVVDTTPPTIVVSSDKTTLGSTQTATINFTLSEVSSDFTAGDVTVIGGSLSNFQGSGVNYTATFSPTAGATSAAVLVGSDTFRDAASNLNKDGAESNNAVSLTISNTPTDTTPPTIIVATDKTLLSSTQTATITFTLSENSTDFSLADATVIGGSLSNLQGSGNYYTATFTPTAGATSAAVVVSSNRFSDAAGNFNQDGGETNNAVSLTINNTPSDTTPPTIIVATDKTTLSNTQTATISFTLSEASTDFAASDVTVIGGSLSNFQGSGVNYTATFTPTAGATSAAVMVSSDTFRDAASNLNKDGAESNNAVSLTISNTPTDTTPPTIIVATDKTLLSSTQTATITFTLSENSTDFGLADATVIGGSLSNLQGSGNYYTATFTPTAGATSAAVVVSSNRFSDAAGNFNQDGGETNNAVSLTISNTPTDTTPPTIIVSTDKTTLSNTQTATISFTLSEASTDFTSSDVTVIGGSLSNFQGNGVNYTATFTPTAGATSAAVLVSSNAFGDVAGNLNNDGAESNNAVSLTISNTSTDTTPPTIALSSNKSSLAQGESAIITFALSESSTDFTVDDVAVAGGSLSNFQGSGANYTATYTPAGNATGAVIRVESNKFSDASANFNQDGGDTNNLITMPVTGASSDNTAPTMVVTSNKTTLPSNGTATITFALSEASADFNASDVSVAGGVLSNFQGSGASYTATFTPSAGASGAVVSVDSGKFSDAAGNFNQDGSDANNVVMMLVSGTSSDTTPPTIAISSNKESLSTGESALITFTLSESSNDFNVGDVDVAGGALSNFQGSGTSYSATFTPTADATGGVVYVDSNKFSDASGNLNDDGNDDNNIVMMPVVTQSAQSAAVFSFMSFEDPAPPAPPAPVITDDTTGIAANAQTVTFNFDFNKDVIGFDINDITVANGTKGEFQTISPSQYSLQVTMPTGSAASTGTAVVSVLDGSYTDLNAQAGLAAHGTQLFSGNGDELIQGAVVQSSNLQVVVGQLPNGQTGEYYPAASNGLYYTVLEDQGPAISDIPVSAPSDSYWQIQSYLDAVRMQDGRVALIWKGVDTITQQASWGYQIMAADGSSTDEPVALSDQLGTYTGALSLVALEGGGFAIDQAQLDGTANHTVFTTAQTDLIRVGTSASNTLIGGDGDDQLIAGGGADMVYAGAGNDVVSIDLSNNANLMNPNASTRIDGGSGDNQLRLVGAMETTLDLTNTLVGHRLGHFSHFDITGQLSDANTTLANGIELNVSDVLQYGKSDGWGGHTVQIDGDANDTVTLSNLLDDGSDTGQWDLLGSVDQSGRTYSQYSFSSNQNLQVFIDQQIASQWI